MKVKDLILKLKSQNPESEVVMKNLYSNPLEPSYVMKEIRAYEWRDRVVIDGYDRQVVK